MEPTLNGSAINRLGKLLPAAALVLLTTAALVFAQEAIKKGQYLKITVIGYPSFDRQVRVEDDGTIFYPYLQDVPVAGMSPAELQTMLLQVLQKYLESPVVLVEILERYTVQVQVLGQVKIPGMLQVPAGLDVQSAISLAGGATLYADLSGVKVMRPEDSEPDGWLELKADIGEFMLTGDLDLLPRLDEGDIVVVPGAGIDAYVMVIGSVFKPGSYLPPPDATLLQMILLSGGYTDDADLAKIKVIRHVGPTEYKRVEVNLEMLMEREQYDKVPRVSGGDVVVVPEKRRWVDWDRLNSLIRDIYVVVALYVIYIRVK